MYDKSKKTWSQRLKIHKNEKATTNDSPIATTLAAATASALTVTTTAPQNIEATANVAHNVSTRTSPMPQYQLKPTAIMHLPTLNDYHHQQGSEYMPQHLGRSMKYAEPWLYGTVRGIPTRPAGLYHPAYAHYVAHPHAATIFAAPNNELRTGATAVAVVLCSCPEYLSGTKGRTLKKPSLCKKCKGTRLPLANIGGTVRLTSNIPSSKLRPVGASSTVRVVSSTKKQRPTILDPQKDPYDLMRRTRLLSPEPGIPGGGGGVGSSSVGIGKDKARNRGRSASPVRGRSRTRHHHKALVSSCNMGESSKTLEALEDSWLTESEEFANTPSSSNRRSILRCNVNPYDLISINQQVSCQDASTSKATTETLITQVPRNNRKQKQKLQYSQNEFMPPNDDFNVRDAGFPEDEPSFTQRSNKTKAASSKVDIKKVKEDSVSLSVTPPPQNKIPNYGNVQAIAGQRISFGDEQPAPKSLLQQTADGTATYESFAIETEKPISKETEKPTKPRPDTLQVKVAGEPKRSPRANKTQNENEVKDTQKTPEKEDEELLVTVTVTPTHNIKSILKRPTSKSSENGDVTQTDSSSKPASLPSTPKPKEGSTSSSKSGTPTNSRRNPLSNQSPTTNSQFYIPMPQARKKVQFVVDDNQQQLNESPIDRDSSSPSPASVAGDLKINYEYYNKKRHQKQLEHLSETDTENSYSTEEPEEEIITYDEKFIQAMLLEKLQLDSEMVSQRYKTQKTNETLDRDDTSDIAFLDNALTFNKTDYEDVFSTIKQSKSQFSKQQEYKNKTVATNIQHNELNINENLSYDKQSLSSSSLTATETTNCQLSSPPSLSLTSSSSSSPAVSPSSTTGLATHHVADMSDKIDDMVNEFLPTNEKIFIAAFKDRIGGDGVIDDDDDNNNSSYNVDVSGDHVISSTYKDVDANIEASEQHHHNDNNQNVKNVNISSHSSPISKSQNNEAQTSTATSDYYDDAKIKQQEKSQQQQLQQFNNSIERKKDIETLAARDRNILSSRTATKETQSRNPIRRSQSERQPSTYQNNSNSNNNGYNHNNKKNGSSSSRSVVNDNIISNGRNSLKDTEHIPNIKDTNTNHGSEGVEGKANKTLVNFQDTMALRNRYNRNDTRDLFTMAIVGRPREAPPPPPPPSSSLGNSLPLAVVLKESAKCITLATDAIEVCQQHPQSVSGLESKQRQQQHTTIGHELKLTTTTTTNNITFCKEINGATLIEGKDKQQPQMVGSGKLVTTTHMTNMENTSTNISSLDKSNKSKELTTKPLQQHHQQRQQKTVVRVAPFNKNSFEVHRLKISHTDNMDNNNCLLQSPMTPKITNTPNSICSNNFSTSSHYSVTDLSTLNTSHEYGQQKTSILISGDDCYSTMNLSCDDSSTPLYQSSVVVADGSLNSSRDMEGLKVTNTYNTVTINLSSPRSSEDELIQQHNQLNNLLKRQSKSSLCSGSIRAIIPIRGTIDINLQRSASSTSSTSTSSITSSSSSTCSSSSAANTSKRGKTLIRLDYDKEKSMLNESPRISSTMINENLTEEADSEWLPHETELLKILRNPVEAVKRNLVPHICKRETDTQKDSRRSKKMNEGHSEIVEIPTILTTRSPLNKSLESSSFIEKLLEDPMLNQVAEGLENDTVMELIENSLKRLQESRNALDMTGTKDNEDMNRLIDVTLKRIQEERHSPATKDTSAANNSNSNLLTVPTTKEEERISNRGSISSANSFASAHNYELFDFEAANESDCYQSCSSEANSLMEDYSPSPETKSKFYQMLVDATLQEIELSTNIDDANIEDEHQYESIRQNIDPIYEEISDMPPPLPLSAPPLNDPELEKKSARSIFEGASKYDILSYLVDAKERGLVKEEPFDYPLNCSNPIIIEEESTDTLSDLGKLSKLKRIDTISSRSSMMSDSSDDNQSSMSSLSPPSSNNFMLLRKQQATSDIERNDSGVGSETSKSSRSKYFNASNSFSGNSHTSSTNFTTQPRSSPLHLCEDCDGPVETQIAESGSIFAPLVCRKCGKKRVERKEIITEVVETEEKYGRDLQIILEEFCHPMLVAGLLTQEQLSAIFLNTEELLENNQTLAERMRDSLDIALEQGDDDLLTVNIGKIFLDSTQMLHAFESYCVRQAGASLLLANLEKDKELLRIFLKVSQMENAVLRRMNLNSFLMVPVQRVTKYPLLLARLYKVTPAHLEGRDQLKQAQEKIELHLNHINQEAKDVPTKLWRRISSSSPNRRASCEIDMINIKLRKMAIDVLEWNHDEVRFVMEGKLLYTQPTDSNWKKARTIKLTTVNALLVTNGKPSTNYKAEKVMSDKLNFPKHTGIREASLLVVKEKCGRYTLIREPLYLDRCVVCSEADWDEYFEIQEISSKDTFIFKAEDNVRTKQWYTQLQYHAQGMGAWRKRRNALANIMINGMLTRN